MTAITFCVLKHFIIPMKQFFPYQECNGGISHVLLYISSDNNFFHMCHLVRTTLHENTCSYKLYLILIHLLTSYIILSTYCFMHMQYTHADSVNITERAEANL